MDEAEGSPELRQNPFACYGCQVFSMSATGNCFKLEDQKQQQQDPFPLWPGGFGEGQLHRVLERVQVGMENSLLKGPWGLSWQGPWNPVLYPRVQSKLDQASPCFMIYAFAGGRRVAPCTMHWR